MYIAIIAATIILIIVLFIVTGNYFYTIAIKPGGFAKLIKPTEDTETSAADIIDDNEKNWWSSMPVETIHITSHDGLVLQGYFLENDNPTNRLVILAHGYAGEASEMAVYARIYYDKGFDIFAPDNRGHGKSEGKSIGMGWLDREDYLQWIELLVSRKGGRVEIILHGHSMGGAIVSILSGEKLLPNVKGIISDCAYDSVKNVLAWQLKNIFKLPSFPIIPIASIICKLRAGYYLGEGNVTAQVKRSKIPILYIHGDKDTFVSSSMVHNLYNATEPSLREIWVVCGAGHIESIKVAHDEYVSRISAFVDRISGTVEN